MLNLRQAFRHKMAGVQLHIFPSDRTGNGANERCLTCSGWAKKNRGAWEVFADDRLIRIKLVLSTSVEHGINEHAPQPIGQILTRPCFRTLQNLFLGLFPGWICGLVVERAESFLPGPRPYESS